MIAGLSVAEMLKGMVEGAAVGLIVVPLLFTWWVRSADFLHLHFSRCAQCQCRARRRATRKARRA